MASTLLAVGALVLFGADLRHRLAQKVFIIGMVFLT